MALQFDDPSYAAVILAGGEGVRLSSFTRRIFGYHLPKQFCPLFDGKTLLEQTMRRVSILVPPSQTITVLNSAHERFYSALLGGTASRNLFVQPENRGTAPAILGALLRLIEAGHTNTVAIFPSDHFVGNDSVFMRHVADAFYAVDRSPRLIVLLGITPDGPETEYGWAEPGKPVAGTHPAFGQISHIRSFWEKPSPAVAGELYDRGYLWNSFIVVANTEILRSLIAVAVPRLYTALARVRSSLGTVNEKEAFRAVYRDLSSIDFPRSILAEFATELAVLRVAGVSWSDLGDPERLLAVISSSGHRRIWRGRPNVPGNEHLAVPGGQGQISQHKGS
jgi:mannose-1-phosphate guanylyltransferase